MCAYTLCGMLHTLFAARMCSDVHFVGVATVTRVNVWQSVGNLCS